MSASSPASRRTRARGHCAGRGVLRRHGHGEPRRPGCPRRLSVAAHRLGRGPRDRASPRPDPGACCRCRRAAGTARTPARGSSAGIARARGRRCAARPGRRAAPADQPRRVPVWRVPKRVGRRGWRRPVRADPGRPAPSGSVVGHSRATIAWLRSARGRRVPAADDVRPAGRRGSTDGDRSGLQSAHVQQVVDQPVPAGRATRPSVASSSASVRRRSRSHVAAAQASSTAALADGERRAQVVADRGEQRGAHPVGLGDRPGGCGLGGQPLLLERGGRVGGEGAEHPAVGGAQRAAAQGHQQRGGDLHVGVRVLRAGHRGAAGAGHRGPVRGGRGRHPGRLGGPFQQRDRFHAERLADPVEHRFQGLLAAQHAAGRGHQQLGLGGGPGRLLAAPGGVVHHLADHQPDRDKHAKRGGVVGLGDRELVKRRGEVEVEQQQRPPPPARPG